MPKPTFEVKSFSSTVSDFQTRIDYIIGSFSSDKSSISFLMSKAYYIRKLCITTDPYTKMKFLQEVILFYYYSMLNKAHLQINEKS